MTIGPITLDCASVPEPDAGSIECMAHLQLAAIQRGADLSIENASVRLRELIAFCGLAEALGVEVERHAE
jgi:ABC-type transporter Mla MlaB component